MNDFVTIAIYDDYLSANFDKQRLLEQGIECYLADENTVTIQWTLKNALGGIKLRVPALQTEEAIKVLNEKREELSVDFKLDETENDRICPNCGSNNTATKSTQNQLQAGHG